jgi:signal transduction histidine kinase
MEIMHIFNSLTRSKNIEMRIKFTSYVPEFLRCDKRRMQQVLRNYLSNAVKFTLRGGIVKVIASYSERTEELSVSVVDSGIGVMFENV